MGITPGGGEIISPDALSSGWRTQADFGNAGQNRSWIIKPLAPGLYYWSVQSVDHAFAGSSFAAEQSFFLSDPVLPVELTDFNARLDGADLLLTWTTASETNNAGFEVQLTSALAAQEAAWETLAYVPGAGTTTAPQSYSYRIQNLSAGTYLVRLKQIDFDGRFEYSQILTIEAHAPEDFSLHPNYPNPFNPSTEITYELPVSTEVKLAVFDIRGKQVAVLVDHAQVAGRYTVTFNGSQLPSGTYFYQLETPEKVLYKQMILLK